MKKTDRQVKLIVNNIVRACSDITKLNNTGYKYIYLASGFIAHYNRYGFISHYLDCADLRSDILESQKWNQYNNFHPGEENYEYYKQKAEIYNKICEQIK